MGARGFRPIRKTAADGTLLEAGYRWIEQDRNLEALLKEGSWGTLVFAGFLYFAAVNWPWPSGGLMLLCNVALFGALGCAIWHVIFIRKRRSVIFRSDGAVLTPHGIPARWYRRRLKIHHRTIMSLESAVRMGDEYYVRLITQEGDLIWIGWHLDDAEALKIAVQLTKALGELRLEAADARMRITVPQGAHARSAPEIIN